MPLLEARYINHEGKKIEFGKGDGLFLNEHDLLNFSWNVQTRGNRIISVNRKGVKEHTLPLIIAAQTEAQACKLANDLFSVCEADLQANTKGRLVVNGYNLKCFIRGQEYSEWSETAKVLKISAKVIRDAVWYKTLQPITFNTSGVLLPVIHIPIEDVGASPDAGSPVEEWTGGDKGYYHGYPYDYPSTLEEFNFENTTGVPLSWKAIIYGGASVITFDIGGHTYAVPGVTLEDGERLEITAKESLDEKTVIKYKADGDTENCFAYRSTESYLFEPIQPGNQLIRHQNGLVWQLIPIIERSTPEWL